MRVKIGDYPDWIGPYQIAEKLLFWMPKSDKRVGALGDFLAGGDGNKTLLYKLCEWVHNKKKRKIDVRIDRYDAWAADRTLAYIILPLLRDIQARKQGAPFVDDEDVPWWLRSHFFTKEHDWNVDPNHFKRWDWIVDEMIWAFEQLVDDDWEDRYHHGHIDIRWKEVEGNSQLSQMYLGPLDTHWFDKDGYDNHERKIANGLRLFGKYYRSLAV